MNRIKRRGLLGLIVTVIIVAVIAVCAIIFSNTATITQPPEKEFVHNKITSSQLKVVNPNNSNAYYTYSIEFKSPSTVADIVSDYFLATYLINDVTVTSFFYNSVFSSSNFQKFVSLIQVKRVFSLVESGEVNSESPNYFDVEYSFEGKEPTAGSVGDGTFIFYIRPDTATAVTGKTVINESYNGSAQQIPKAGYYTLTNLNVKFFDKFAEYDETETIIANSNFNKSGVINYNSSVDTSMPNFTFAYRSTITVNLDSLPKDGANFNLPEAYRVYKGRNYNFRNSLVAYSDTTANNIFAFSTPTQKPFNFYGFDIMDLKSQNLSAYVNFVDIDWYKITDIAGTKNEELVLPGTNVFNSSDYGIKLNWNVKFTPDYLSILEQVPQFNPIVIFNGMKGEVSTEIEYEQNFRVEKRDLFMFEANTFSTYGTVDVQREKEFDNNANAVGLFTGKGLSFNMWKDYCNGLESDYADLSAVLNPTDGYVAMYSFTGSMFRNNFNVGANKEVIMAIGFNSSAFNDTQYEIIKNYSLVFGQYLRGEADYEYVEYTELDSLPNNAELPKDARAFSIGSNFEVLPNKITVKSVNDFNKFITYGDKNFMSDFDINTVFEYTGKIVTSNWKVVFCNESLPTDIKNAENTIFIIVNIGRERKSGEPLVYTDGEGKEYTPYEERLYFNNLPYYFYYKVEVVLANTEKKYTIAPVNGVFPIKDKYDSEGKVIANLNCKNLVSFNIGKKTLVFTVSNVVKDKVYDGNTSLTSFVGGLKEGFGLVDEDKNTNIELYYTVAYDKKNVGDSININLEWGIRYAGSGSTAGMEQIINSYDRSVDESTVPKTGRITKRNLKMRFLNTDILYERNYGENNTVVIRVAKAGDKNFDNDILEYDLYYVFDNEMDSQYYCFENQFSDYNLKNIIKIEFIKEFDPINNSGFVAGEDFKWDINNPGINDFNNETGIDVNGLLSWIDSRKGIAIDAQTPSSKTDTIADYYRLEFLETNKINAQGRIANYSMIPTYEIDGQSNFIYPYLKIKKLDLPTNFISINTVKHLTYGTSSRNTLFISEMLSYNQHRELEQLPLLAVAGVMVEVINYVGIKGVGLSNPRVMNMELSGTYDIIWHLPSTDNYQAKDFTITGIIVDKKVVNTYITSIIREYGEENPNVNSYTNIFGATPEMINQLVEYVDANGKTISYNDFINYGGTKVYRYKNIESGLYENRIYYVGITEEDLANENYVLHNISIANDASADAGAYDNGNGVNGSGGLSDNFDIKQAHGILLILRKELKIAIEDNQEKSYTGNLLTPNYLITGGKGILRFYVTKYVNNQGVENTYSDQNHTEMTASGTYTIKAFAKPDINAGASSTNYKETVTPLDVTFKIGKLNIEWNIKETIKQGYTVEGYTLNSIEKYFIGKGIGDISIVLQSSWGDMELHKIMLGANIISTTDPKVIDSGTYTYFVGLTIVNDNIQLADNALTEWSFNVEIGKSQDISFQFIPPNGAYDQGGNRFTKIYDGMTYLPNYKLSVGGKQISNSDIFVRYTCTIGGAIKNVNVYNLTFEVNPTDGNNLYNSNYISPTFTFTIEITPAPLTVGLSVKAGKSFSKMYAVPISEIADDFYVTFGGWITGEEDLINSISQMPVIDWREVTDESVVSKYTIGTKGGVAPNNYYFDHSFCDIEFSVIPANVTLEVQEEYVYSGKDIVLDIKRTFRGNEITEPVGGNGIEIELLGKFIGSDIHNITNADIDSSIKNCINVDGYVFRITIDASNNFEAVLPTLVYVKIIKKDLHISMLDNKDEPSASNASGYSTKVYDKLSIYPEFRIKYQGFVGVDDSPIYTDNIYNLGHQNVANVSNGITSLGLVHPYYEIIRDNNVITPLNVGSYQVRLVMNNEYGIARNYNIKIDYARSGSEVFPTLEITKRPIDVEAVNAVVKKYDTTNRVLNSSLNATHYRFVKTIVNGLIVEQSGTVAGDTVNLTIDYIKSYYERTTVNDANGHKAVKIKAFGYSIDNENYELIASKALTENGESYIYLNGEIEPTTATIGFFNDKGEPIIGYNTVYNGQIHDIVVKTSGVNGETVSFTKMFTSDTYNSSEAPSDAGRYLVVVTINSPNYNSASDHLTLVIEKAEVKISFSGDGSQKFGSITSGLKAVATGIGSFMAPLTVFYHTKGGIVYDAENINLANVGVYTAKATFSGDGNYNANVGSITFEITPQTLNFVNMEVVDSYIYSGRQLELNVYFQYNNVTYKPVLKFQYWNGREYEPYNYTASAIDVDKKPKNVGKYRLIVTENSQPNFIINGANGKPLYKDFEITPIETVVGIKNHKVNLGAEIKFEFTLSVAAQGETIYNFVKMPDVRYYDSVTGAELNGVPLSAGMYKVEPFGAISDNYIITYSFGILELTNPTLSAPVDTENADNTITVEGAFDAGVTLNVGKIDDIGISKYNTMFSSFVSANSDYAKFSLNKVFELQLMNGGTAINTPLGEPITIRIYAKDLFDKYDGILSNAPVNSAKNADSAEETKYYVVQFDNDTVTMIEAHREGDYLVFETDKITAIAILADASIVSDVTKNNDYWIIGVSIGAGLLLIIIAIVIIKKRA